MILYSRVSHKLIMAAMAIRVTHDRSRHFTHNPYIDDKVVEGNPNNSVGAYTPSKI